MYLKHILIVEPSVSFIREKKVDYERRGLSEKEIREEIVSLIQLLSSWCSYAVDSVDTVNKQLPF